MKLFILALVLYFQNFFFSLFASFVFIPSFIEFASVYILVLLISKTEYKKSLFLFWQFLYLIHFGFISFFGRIITSSDIYLFFTHIVETYETFIYTLDIFIVPFIITMLIFIIVLNIKIKSTKINVYALLFAFATLLIFMPNKIYDASFLLLKSIASTTTIKSSDIKLEANLTKKLISLKKQDINIVLLIGESMRAKEYQNKEYEIFKNYFYKTIYAGATSTDLSLPLLINGAVKPSEINLSNNIFTLAKENDFKTAFITVQSKKSLKYIKPYLHLEDIESFKLLGSRDDMDLLKEFKKIDLQNQTNFVVMQMQGQHSPYIYYPEYKKSTILEQYNESMDYSNRVISEMIK
ncbi:MAG: hypothetical protein U9Q29_04700, partial [Campylobacterota bacterium]|nr:hypothetical protein [Campylobacterota bacterium]